MIPHARCFIPPASPPSTPSQSCPCPLPPTKFFIFAVIFVAVFALCAPFSSWWRGTRGAWWSSRSSLPGSRKFSFFFYCFFFSEFFHTAPGVFVVVFDQNGTGLLFPYYFQRLPSHRFDCSIEMTKSLLRLAASNEQLQLLKMYRTYFQLPTASDWSCFQVRTYTFSLSFFWSAMFQNCWKKKKVVVSRAKEFFKSTYVQPLSFFCQPCFKIVEKVENI